jgi:sugar phosphate isomerase/epimerase
MSEQCRREFLKKAGLGMVTAAVACNEMTASARTNQSQMRLALKGVTYTGVWYNGPALSIPQIIDRAKRFGYAGIEIDAKRPQAFPLDLDRQARQQIREKLAETGVELAAVASYNNFIEPIHEYFEMNLLTVREQLLLARDLGAKILRVFASWPMIATGKDGFGSMGFTRKWYADRIGHLSRQQRLELAVAALKELAPHAEECGVTLAVQNHPPGIERYQDVLAILDAVDSPHVKACIDLQLLRKGEDVRQAVLDTGARQVHVHFGGEFRRGSDGRLECFLMNADFPTYVKALLEIGYQGFLSFEFCHRCTKRDAQGNKLSDELAGIDRVDEQVQLARDFINQVIANAKAARGEST